MFRQHFWALVLAATTLNLWYISLSVTFGFEIRPARIAFLMFAF
jgi:hypothetical protein